MNARIMTALAKQLHVTFVTKRGPQIHLEVIHASKSLWPQRSFYKMNQFYF